jgi:hypothetical protein
MDFSPCKETLENVYEFYTDSQNNKLILRRSELLISHMKKFMDCYFHKTTSLTDCIIEKILLNL